MSFSAYASSVNMNNLCDKLKSLPFKLKEVEGERNGRPKNKNEQNKCMKEKTNGFSKGFRHVVLNREIALSNTLVLCYIISIIVIVWFLLVRLSV